MAYVLGGNGDQLDGKAGGDGVIAYGGTGGPGVGADGVGGYFVTVQAGRLGNSEAGLSLRRRDAIAAER